MNKLSFNDRKRNSYEDHLSNISYSEDINRHSDESSKGEIKYNYISQCGKRKPDIYIGSLALNANEFRIIEEEEDPSTVDSVTENEEEVSISEYDFLLKEKLRYFNAYNVTKKCFNCNGNGHIALVCPEQTFIYEDVCFKCNEPGHLAKECKNFRCFRCNKIGHINRECKERNLIRCFKCRKNGHESEDCLACPSPVLLENNNIHCLLCNSEDHFIERATIKKLFPIEKDLMNTDMFYYMNNFYCPNCGNNHRLEECDKNKNKYSTQTHTTNKRYRNSDIIKYQLILN